MKKLALVLGCALGALALTAAPALAIPNFQKEFKAKYVDDNGNSTFVAAVEKVKCNVCHVGTKKTDRNPYGEQLSKLLDKKDDKDDVDKIKEALDKVAAMKSDPGNDSSPTYGDLIKSGKLPGGDAE